MFKAVKLPASIADLNSGLSDVDRNALPHFRFCLVRLSSAKGDLNLGERNTRGVYKDASGVKVLQIRKCGEMVVL